jgi:hypothetical protein
MRTNYTKAQRDDKRAENYSLRVAEFAGIIVAVHGA